MASLGSDLGGRQGALGADSRAAALKGMVSGNRTTQSCPNVETIFLRRNSTVKCKNLVSAPDQAIRVRAAIKETIGRAKQSRRARFDSV
jgi:hypothetical protein